MFAQKPFINWSLNQSSEKCLSFILNLWDTDKIEKSIVQEQEIDLRLRLKIEFELNIDLAILIKEKSSDIGKQILWNLTEREKQNMFYLYK